MAYFARQENAYLLPMPVAPRPTIVASEMVDEAITRQQVYFNLFFKTRVFSR